MLPDSTPAGNTGCGVLLQAERGLSLVGKLNSNPALTTGVRVPLCVHIWVQPRLGSTTSGFNHVGVQLRGRHVRLCCGGGDWLWRYRGEPAVREAWALGRAALDWGAASEGCAGLGGSKRGLRWIGR